MRKSTVRLCLKVIGWCKCSVSDCRSYQVHKRAKSLERDYLWLIGTYNFKYFIICNYPNHTLKIRKLSLKVSPGQLGSNRDRIYIQVCLILMYMLAPLLLHSRHLSAYISYMCALLISTLGYKCICPADWLMSHWITICCISVHSLNVTDISPQISFM